MNTEYRKAPTTLMPRFTILWIMILMAALAIFFTVVRFAILNHEWAIAITTAVGALCLAMAMYALVFLVVLGVSRRLSRHSRFLGIEQKPESPFATHKLPPQMVPPVDPD